MVVAQILSVNIEHFGISPKVLHEVGFITLVRYNNVNLFDK